MFNILQLNIYKIENNIFLTQPIKKLLYSYIYLKQ